MGRSKRKRRCKGERPEERALPAAHETSAPQAALPLFGPWFTRFAIAFLIIFLLLWLFAPREENR